MVRSSGLAGAAALIGACLVACSNEPTVTAKVVTLDDREAGLATHDARESPDARESGSVVEPAQCESLPLADDVRCPDAEFPYGACPMAGQRCLSSIPGGGVRSVFRCEANRYNATQPPTWNREAYFYDPRGIPPLPKDRTFDTSDCASRPVVACACRAGETSENAIERNQTISRCQITNPTVFLTFDDAGCPTRAHYDDTTWSTVDFESCLADAFSGVRFDCASSASRVVLITQSKE